MFFWLFSWLFYYAFIVLIIIQLGRLFMADADLWLLLWEKYGAKPDVLQGQVVWITGASSGIGENLAYALANVGCKLILSARRGTELERVKRNCVANSKKITEGDILVLPFDLKEIDRHTTLTQRAIEKFGHIDILVNNGARSQRALIKDTEVEVDKDMFHLLVLAQISLTKALLPHFLERKKGHVVVTSSIAGKIGAPNSATYSACKFALQGYFETMRLELARDNIDVTLVCPGPIRTNAVQHAYTGKLSESNNDRDEADSNRMSAERCADLMSVAMANKLAEVWISENPVLFFTYAGQYLPDVFRALAKFIGVKYAKNIRDGKKMTAGN